MLSWFSIRLVIEGLLVNTKQRIKCLAQGHYAVRLKTKLSFESHCVVSLSKTLYRLFCTSSTLT